MIPRDQYGNKEPMATRDGLDREILYPYWKLDEHGRIRPMVFFDEFVNGKIPAYDPNYAASIVYHDPVLNLPYTEQRLIHIYRENPRKGLEIQITGQNAAIDSDVDTSTKVINATSTRMVVRTAKGDVHLANFSIEAVDAIW